MISYNMATPSTSPRITFNDKSIFGKGFNRNIANTMCVVAKMVNDNVLNMDGTIDRRDHIAYQNVLKRDMWLYVYYLWQHNRHLEVFDKMTLKQNNDIPKGSAKGFIFGIIGYMQSKGYSIIDHPEILTKDNVADFIDQVIIEYSDKIEIPFLKNIYRRVYEKQDEYNRMLEQENQELDRKIQELKDQGPVVNETDIYVMDENSNHIVMLKPKDQENAQPIKLQINVRTQDGGRQHRRKRFSRR